MTPIAVKDLLEAGVHFGHQTRRWNPKMRRFIFGERNGIHIIDLQQTERLLANAQQFAAGVAARGGTVLFVGTKKQARDTIEEAATAAGMPYVSQRWLGGLLTNFQTIGKRINIERTEEALATGAKTIAVGCPFCSTMITDATRSKGAEEVEVIDVASVLLRAVKPS